MIGKIHRLLGSISANTINFKGKGRIIDFINKLFLKLGIDPVVTAKMHNGTVMLVDLRSFENSSFYYGRNDDYGIDLVSSFLKDGLIFLDIGSNIGFYTIPIAKYIKNKSLNCKVYSFEPLESNFNRMKENIKLNNVSKKISSYNIGLSDNNGQAKLILRDDFKKGSKTGNASIENISNDESDYKTVNIKLKKLDEIWSDINQDNFSIGIIKLDIEGHEPYFLRGANKVIENNLPAIYMEVNNNYFNDSNSTPQDLLTSALPEGYIFFRKVKGQDLWLQDQIKNCNLVEDIMCIHSSKIDDHKNRFKLK